MRKITDHKVNGLNDALEVTAIGEPGPGGANHHYELRLQTGIRELPDGSSVPVVSFWPITFQNGPIASPADFNGITNEALLAVLIDRMRGFQSGPFACRENALALTKLEEAMMWLQFRTRARMARGVEGTLKP